MRTRSRILLPVVSLALLGGACAGDGELGGPAPGGTPAAVVGDVTVSSAELADEVESWASNPAMLEAVQVPEVGQEGRRASPLVTFVLTHRIISEQARLMLMSAREEAESGLDLAQLGVDGEMLSEPSEQQIGAILEQLDLQFSGPEGVSVFRGFDDDFRRLLARDLAYQDRLQILTQLGIEAPEVSVNPRYGRTQEFPGGVVQVIAPTGPRSAPIAG